MTEEKSYPQQTPAPALVYLDHSALNQLRRGRRPKILELLTRSEFQTAYSDENLNEISNSTGSEQEFISLLSALNAKHLRLILDEKFQCTDRYLIEMAEPDAAYTAYIQNRNESPSFDGGMSDMLKKFYGGHSDKLFEQILHPGERDLIEEIKALVYDLSSDTTISRADIESITQLLPQAEQEITSLFSALAQQLDANDAPANVKTVDTALSLGPTVLNNIRGPDVVKQVWNHISKQLPDGAMTCDEHFGAVRPRWLAANQTWTKLQQVNHVYHQLNFAGYRRDENMHRRFNAHFNDLTHVGMAAFCHLFFTGDERQSLKASAAYECLDIKTRICYLKP